jgi:hypothetical protein
MLPFDILLQVADQHSMPVHYAAETPATWMEDEEFVASTMVYPSLKASSWILIFRKVRMTLGP